MRSAERSGTSRGAFAWPLPGPQAGCTPALVSRWWPPTLAGTLALIHDVCPLRDGPQTAGGGGVQGQWLWRAAFPGKPVGLGSPRIPRPGGAGGVWPVEAAARGPGPLRLPAPGGGDRGRALSGSLLGGTCGGSRRDGGGLGGAARAAGRVSPGGAGSGGAGWGRARGGGPPFLPAPGQSASRSGDGEVGDSGRGPRRDGGRGRAAFQSHWRTGRAELINKGPGRGGGPSWTPRPV